MINVKRVSEVFAYHGALGERIPTTPPNERERMRCARAVFYFLPVQALRRNSVDVLVKPLIRARLESLGLSVNDQVTSVFKGIADQYFQTSRFGRELARYCPRKLGVPDLKAGNMNLLRRLREEQNHRCAYCGILFVNCTESLDHVIPWRLIGDPPDGSNYQLLCSECNSAKGDLLSCYQAQSIHNWMYSIVDSVDGSRVLRMEEFRHIKYVRLALSSKCQVHGCTATSRNSILSVTRIDKEGVWCFKNTTVKCADHINGDEVLVYNSDRVQSA